MTSNPVVTESVLFHILVPHRNVINVAMRLATRAAIHRLVQDLRAARQLKGIQCQAQTHA